VFSTTSPFTYHPWACPLEDGRDSVR